jgi:hypothetical protein
LLLLQLLLPLQLLPLLLLLELLNLLLELLDCCGLIRKLTRCCCSC